MELNKILIVEDSQSTREYLAELVQILGFQAHAVRQKTDFLPELNQHSPDLLLLGSCPNPGQMKAFARVVELRKSCLPIICLTDGSDGNDMQLGTLPVGDNICYLPESFNPEHLKLTISKMIKDSQESEYDEMNETIIGHSSAIKEIKKHIMRLSQSDMAVLITGESGTGKELVARAIHDFSSRAQKPFVKVNSAALPGNLMESELFGYEKGAFTGAWRNKPGKFVLAHSGTILLDEIGEIPLNLQPKLLQVLEDDELSILGGTRNAKIDVRVLAATNSNLKRRVQEGRFRSDLYYRLNVVAIHIPPLRERIEDIAPLCKHFLGKHAGLNGSDDLPINGKTQEQMYAYEWPGNVRELENTIKSLYVLGDERNLSERLQNQHHRGSATAGMAHGRVPAASSLHSFQSSSRPSLKEVCKEAARKAETETILDVLSYTRWNRRKTATLLKISYKALLNKIKEYEIEDQYRQLVRGQRPPASAEASARQGGRRAEDRWPMAAGSWQPAAGSLQKK